MCLLTCRLPGQQSVAYVVICVLWWNKNIWWCRGYNIACNLLKVPMWASVLHDFGGTAAWKWKLITWFPAWFDMGAVVYSLNGQKAKGNEMMSIVKQENCCKLVLRCTRRIQTRCSEAGDRASQTSESEPSVPFVTSQKASVPAPLVSARASWKVKSQPSLTDRVRDTSLLENIVELQCVIFREDFSSLFLVKPSGLQEPPTVHGLGRGRRKKVHVPLWARRSAAADRPASRGVNLIGRLRRRPRRCRLEQPFHWQLLPEQPSGRGILQVFPHHSLRVAVGGGGGTSPTAWSFLQIHIFLSSQCFLQRRLRKDWAH